MANKDYNSLITSHMTNADDFFKFGDIIGIDGYIDAAKYESPTRDYPGADGYYYSVVEATFVIERDKIAHYFKEELDDADWETFTNNVADKLKGKMPEIFGVGINEYLDDYHEEKLSGDKNYDHILNIDDRKMEIEFIYSVEFGNGDHVPETYDDWYNG